LGEEFLEGGHDIAEDVADCWSKQSENNNHDNSDQNKNQCVLYQTLALFFGCKQHGFSPPFFVGFNIYNENLSRLLH
jgi:hypothetical protein